MMALYWFAVPRFDNPADALKAMAPFGVELRSPYSLPATYWWSDDANGVLLDAGTIRAFDGGAIIVRPYMGLPEWALTRLIAASEETFNIKRYSSPRYSRQRKSKAHAVGFWKTNIVLRAGNDPVAEQVRAAHHEIAIPKNLKVTSQQLRTGNPARLQPEVPLG